MADFFNKVKKGFNKGTATLSVKSSTLMETNKLKGEITTLKKEKTDVFALVGEKFYNMKKVDEINMEEIDQCLSRAFEIDQNIILKEQAIEEALKKQEETLKALEEGDGAGTATGTATSDITCTCGAVVGATTKFCPKCGKKIEQDEIEIEEVQEEEAEMVVEPTTIICECGAELPVGTLFCNQCGRKVS